MRSRSVRGISMPYAAERRKEWWEIVLVEIAQSSLTHYMVIAITFWVLRCRIIRIRDTKTLLCRNNRFATYYRYARSAFSSMMLFTFSIFANLCRQSFHNYVSRFHCSLCCVWNFFFVLPSTHHWQLELYNSRFAWIKSVIWNSLYLCIL